MFCDVVNQKLDLKEDGISLKYFPNKTRIKSGKFGQVMKLPCGYHVRIEERSCFLEEDGRRVIELNDKKWCGVDNWNLKVDEERNFLKINYNSKNLCKKFKIVLIIVCKVYIIKIVDFVLKLYVYEYNFLKDKKMG